MMADVVNFPNRFDREEYKPGQYVVMVPDGKFTNAFGPVCFEDALRLIDHFGLNLKAMCELRDPLKHREFRASLFKELNIWNHPE